MLTQSILDKLGITVDQPIKLPMFTGVILRISSDCVLAFPEERSPLEWQFLLRELQAYLGNEHHVKTVVGPSVIDELEKKWLKLELVTVFQASMTTQTNQNTTPEEIDLEFLDVEDGCMILNEPAFSSNRNIEAPQDSTNLDQEASNTSNCSNEEVCIADLASYKSRVSIEPERAMGQSGGAINDLVGITKPKKLGKVNATAFEQLKQLADEQPNCAEAIELVHNALYASYLSNSPASIPNLLLYGVPGTGKTRLMHKISEIIGLPFRDISLAGSCDTFKIVGLSKYWQGSDAGLVVRTLSSIEFANPVFLFDEIDKAGTSIPQGHNPLSAVLLLLEPETAKNFRDDYLEIEVDVSAASFVATANKIDELPDQLLSRFVCVEIPSLGSSNQVTVLQNIYRELCASEKYGVFLSDTLPSETCTWLAEQGKKLEIRKLRSMIKLAMQRACVSLRANCEEEAVEIEPIKLTPFHFRSNGQISRRVMGFV